MCARFFVDDVVLDLIGALTASLETDTAGVRCGDIHPSQAAPVITGKQDALHASLMTWGFPRFDGKGVVINARSESAAEKPMFRDSLLRRRCVVPARHFYEWDPAKNMGTFRRPDSPVLFMAGLYDRFQGQDRFTVLTTAANSSVSKFHDRMPVLLEREDLEPWLFDGAAAPGLMQKEMPVLTHWQENEQMSLF